ncbi:MAG: T9SS type A sorting domain-containing protein [Ignavibacteriales bacterium]|nr:T9SS type A sorting domain-containing protein [Ignavibacteriales bacterium]
MIRHVLLFSGLLFVLHTIVFAQDQYRSFVTGSWSASATWEISTDNGSNWAAAATVPGNAATDIVLIRNGHTVTINQNATIASLTVGEGLTGILQYENIATVRSLTVTGDLTIAASGQFNHGLSISVEHQLLIGGNLSIGNSAKLSVYNSSTRGVNVTFNKSASEDQTISSPGTPNTVDFQKVILNRGSAAGRVLCNISVNMKGGNNALQLTNGVWEQSAGTIVLPSSSTGGANWYFGSANGTFKVTGSASATFTSSITGAGGTSGLLGTMVINTSGTVTVGSFNGGANRFENSGNLNIIAGTVVVNGRFTHSSGTTTISGGTINIDPQVTTNLGATSNAFEVTSTGTLNMSNGTVIIVDPNAATGTGMEVKLSGTVNFTGGTIQIGDGVSTTAGSADGFEVYLGSGKYLYNFVVNNPSGTNRHVVLTDHTTKKDANVSNSISIVAGELKAAAPDAASSNINLSGSWSNSGTFTPGTTTGFTLNGTAPQTISSTFPASVYNLTVNNATGAVLQRDINVTNTLALTSGDIDLNGNTLTLGSLAMLSETAGNTVTGTSGKITTTRDIATPAAANVGGLGAVITSDLNLGSTTVERYHSARIGNGQTGINRYYNIVPGQNNSGQNATLRFMYDESELAGITEANLSLFKSADGSNNSWTEMQGTVDEANNFVELTGISDFSFWTLGDHAAPLPVELTLFTAEAQNGKIVLRWKTATEINNMGFEIERSRNKNSFVKIGFVEGYGNSNSTKEYRFTDENTPAGKYVYRLKQIDNDGTFEYSKEAAVDIAMPAKYALEQNYPNPFNPATRIQYSISSPQHVLLKVFNILGNETGVLVNERKEPGTYIVNFSAANLPSGIYYYRLEAGSFTETKQMIVLK